jgi:hypothetical protein
VVLSVNDSRALLVSLMMSAGFGAAGDGDGAVVGGRDVDRDRNDALGCSGCHGGFP